MEDKLQSFRQPLVTATGIILGFILNFASSFVKTDTDISDLVAYLIGVSVLAGIIALIVVLYRVLRMDYNRQNADKYYKITLGIFIFGVSISFLGVMIDMFSHFMS